MAFLLFYSFVLRLSLHLTIQRSSSGRQKTYCNWQTNEQTTLELVWNRIKTFSLRCFQIGCCGPRLIVIAVFLPTRMNCTMKENQGLVQMTKFCICNSSIIRPVLSLTYKRILYCICHLFIFLWFSRMYRAEKLPSTNLVFLITDAQSTCASCDAKTVRQAEQPCILLLKPWTLNPYTLHILPLCSAHKGLQ